MVAILFYYRKKFKLAQHPILRNTCTFQTERQVSKFELTADDKSFNPPLSQDEALSGTKLGVDSHADTSCVNKHAYIETVVEGMTVDAIPFDSQLGKMSNLPIVHAIYAYDDVFTSRTTLIRINNAIYIRDMENALLCPNQAREYGTIEIGRAHV